MATSKKSTQEMLDKRVTDSIHRLQELRLEERAAKINLYNLAARVLVEEEISENAAKESNNHRRLKNLIRPTNPKSKS
jgi:hypothetical protein